jgi:hypothetical protein
LVKIPLSRMATACPGFVSICRGFRFGWPAQRSFVAAWLSSWQTLHRHPAVSGSCYRRVLARGRHIFFLVEYAESTKR